MCDHNSCLCEPIKTPEQYEVAVEEIRALIKDDGEPGTEVADYVMQLAEKVDAYEDRQGSRRPGRTIVKVQLSITTTPARRQVRIYNEDRTIDYTADADDELVKELDGELKSYWYTNIGEDGMLSLEGLACPQDW